MMDLNSSIETPRDRPTKKAPILVVPYMWIGDFVRCHSVVKVLNERYSERPVDVLATTLCAPLADYMPGIRQAIAWDLPRGRLALAEQSALAARLKRERYGNALVMPRTWKSALAPFLAGIPQRTGFLGEARLLLLNDVRLGERRLPRMVDRCAMLALPSGASQPPSWPLPELAVPPASCAAWRQSRDLNGEGRPIVALAPGAVGPSKRWPAGAYAALARRLLANGASVWVLGGPAEKALAGEIIGDTAARDLTGPDLRNAIFALASATAAISNDFGPVTRRGGARHSDGRHFRADKSLALGAVKPARCNGGNGVSSRMQALPQAGLPAGPPQLYARDRGRPGVCRGSERACGRGFGSAAGPRVTTCSSRPHNALFN